MISQNTQSVIVISASSDIGFAACERWANRGWAVAGTYRTPSDQVTRLQQMGISVVHCDLCDKGSIQKACNRLRNDNVPWDVLMICPATLEPIMPFLQCDFDEWERSVNVNFTQQMRFAHALLPERRQDGPQIPIIILWAGPGTNNAPQNYSAEIVSKIAQIKMCELLDAEIPDLRTVVVGPGWVKTKIHDETLRAGEMAGANHDTTVRKMSSDDCTPMDQIIDFLDWTIEQPREVVSGRNFSVVNDLWGNENLSNKLAQTPDMYKLRRYLNDWQDDGG